VIVLDTHVLVWWMWDSKRLSRRAAASIASALREGPVAVSAMSIFEIATAVRRGRMAFAIPVDQVVDDLRLLPELHFEPVGHEIARRAGGFAESAPGDPADRMIAATAMALRARLVTADRKLAKLPGLETVW
jgi:PIN domain nuclease of toxin-antitoxin system